VLGAGQGWAKSILFHATLREQFRRFFHDSTKFALGVCNGCQMLSGLSEIIPGSDHWPRFDRNQSEQFEARLSFVEIVSSSSILFSGMEGAILPVVVSHGEGRAVCSPGQLAHGQGGAVRYVDETGCPTESYPQNPNGSPKGLTGFTNEDGRITLMMPHPERVFRQVQMSWRPTDWPDIDESPWMKMFRNAYEWAIRYSIAVQFLEGSTGLCCQLPISRFSSGQSPYLKTSLPSSAMEIVTV
jgi:phosphoribosylformylglycinamidine synthase